jgi:hypothetical protein
MNIDCSNPLQLQYRAIVGSTPWKCNGQDPSVGRSPRDSGSRLQQQIRIGMGLSYGHFVPLFARSATWRTPWGIAVATKTILVKSAICESDVPKETAFL